jgi:MOSC domain-containing protein YiiM
MGEVAAVAARKAHRISKDAQLSIRLIAGQGVAGDAHCGQTVKHRSRVAKDPHQPNLRQVHLVQGELLDALSGSGLQILPAAMGENILTKGIDLLAMPEGTRLKIGLQAVVELTGLRNPCNQLNRLVPGLMAALIEQAPDGSLIRKAGVMGVVLQGGDVWPGDSIEITLPVSPHRPLQPV